MSYCQWLHVQLEQLPLISYPFNLNDLPDNGIYFFYERGENWGHGGHGQRIVRIGTSRDGNFQSRISEHYLLNDSKMTFNQNKPAPHERSIFRKNIGRALLNRDKDEYLKVWEMDFTSREDRDKYGHLRNITKEKEIEAEITSILRNNFSFRFIIINDQNERMGAGGFESKLIGTVSHCNLCRPSLNWLGRFSPITKIQESGMWLVQHLNDDGIIEQDKGYVNSAINTVLEEQELRD